LCERLKGGEERERERQRERQKEAYVIGGHERFHKRFIRLSQTCTVVPVQRAKSFDFIVQMLDQRLREAFEERPQLLPVKLLRRTSPAIPLKRLESRGESPVLLDILFHQPCNTGNALDGGEEDFLLGVVVVVHGFAPALAGRQEVAGGGYIVLWEMGCLEVEGVEAADDAVVGEGHLGCDVGG
jgi:hypothetical protein